MKHSSSIACFLFSSSARGFTHWHLNPHKITNGFVNSNPRVVPSATKRHAWSPFGTKTSTATDNAPPPPEDVTTAPAPLDSKNLIAAGVWISLVAWSALLAPGTPGSDADNTLLATLVGQPVPRPAAINEIWFAIWNSFVVVPAVIASLTAPTGRGQRLPAAPFLWGAAFFGYFSLGPYFATRAERRGEERLRSSDLGWASRHIFERRWFGVALLAVSLSIPVTSDLLVPGFDWGGKVAAFGAMISESRFVAVATADIVIMSILSSVLVAEDCRLRGWDDRRALVSLGTLLLPVVGPTLYLAARPRLEE